MSENPIVTLTPSNIAFSNDQFSSCLFIRGWFLGFYSFQVRQIITPIKSSSGIGLGLLRIYPVEINETFENCLNNNRVLIKGYENFENNFEINFEINYSLPVLYFSFDYDSQQYNDYFKNKQFLFKFDFGAYRPTKLQIFLYNTYLETHLVQERSKINILMDCPSPLAQYRTTPYFYIRLEEPQEVLFYSVEVDLF